MRPTSDIIIRFLLCLTLLSATSVMRAAQDADAGRYPTTPIVLPSDSGYFTASNTADATLWGYAPGNGDTYGREIYYQVTLPERMSLIVHTYGSELMCTRVQIFGPGYATIFRARDKVEFFDYYINNNQCDPAACANTQDCFIAFDCPPGTYEIRTCGEKVYNGNAVNGPITVTVTGFAEDIPEYPGIPPEFVPGTAGHPFLLGKNIGAEYTMTARNIFSDSFFAARGFTSGMKGKIYYGFSTRKDLNFDIHTPSHVGNLTVSGNRLPPVKLDKSPLYLSECPPGDYIIEVENYAPIANFAVRVWPTPPPPDYDLYQPISIYDRSIVGKNFVSTRTMLDSSASDSIEEIGHVDGLGRPVQTVSVNASPAGGSIVSASSYDSAGRPDRTWIPGTASVLSGAYAEAISYGNSPAGDSGEQPILPPTPPLPGEPVELPPIFPSDPDNSQPEMSAACYSLTEYEPSPLQRPIRQYSPSEYGLSADTAVTYEYALNHGDGLWNCICFSVTDTPLQPDVPVSVSCSASSGGSVYYSPGELTVVRTTDEDGHTSYEFHDVYDRTVLSRRMLDDGSPADTYYCYDSFGNLTAVLPPEASSRIAGPTVMVSGQSEILDGYCYVYTYNSRGLMASKKLPGCPKVINQYDVTDRLIAWQDGNLRQFGLWRFELADEFGRPCLSGTCSSIGLNATASMVRARRDQTGTLAGYKVTGADLADAYVLSASYYDDYTFIGLDGFPEASVMDFRAAGDYGDRYPDARGKLTGTMTALDPGAGASAYKGKYLYTAMYYDVHDRVVQSVATNHLGGTDRTFTAYDFTGHPVSTETVHTVGDAGQETVQQTQRTYDRQGRPLTVDHRMGREGEWTSLSSMAYDRLGRLGSEQRGSVGTATMTYSYDLRSRLTSMSSTLYGQNLRYTPGDNIASMTWSAGPGRPQRSYEFGYDGLSRLTCARYDDSSGGKGKFDTSYTYDLNGNITALTRKGDMSPFSAGRYPRPVTIDSLTLEYSGNRLIRVTDAATGPFHQGVFHFIDGADEPVEYLYDDNGNTVRDINRGIVAGHFDFNNRPRMLEFADGSSTAYLYDDTGTKLRTIHRVAKIAVILPGAEVDSAGLSAGLHLPHRDPVHSTSAIAETVTDYCRGIIYEDGEISRINLDGGYLSYTDPAGNRLTEPQYHFYLHDHLGNNRADVSASGLVCQQTDYYPYGLPMSSSANTSYQRWLFGGKELDRISGLDLYDQEARAYDPALGRFRSVDAFAEIDYDISPFVYCGSNPIIRFDSDGNIFDTIWDVGNVIYDVGAAVYNHVKGDHETAKGHWADAGFDVAAALIPCVPAGATKAFKVASKTAKSVDKVSDVKKTTEAASEVAKATDKSAEVNNSKALLKKGRSGRQAKLKELGNDPKLGKADRGWIKQEQNRKQRGKRTPIRNPKGKVLAHPRGKEASKGHSYRESNLQLESNHKLQHKYDNNGRRNKPK